MEKINAGILLVISFLLLVYAMVLDGGNEVSIQLLCISAAAAFGALNIIKKVKKNV